MIEKNNRGAARVKGYFGRGVLGPELYEEEQEEVANLSTVFGPGVTGVGLPNQAVNAPGHGVTGQQSPAIPEEPTTSDAPSLSVTKLEEALQENPQLVDAFLPVELNRAGGPRKGALLALEIAENRRVLGHRKDVLAQIAAALPAEE